MKNDLLLKEAYDNDFILFRISMDINENLKDKLKMVIIDSYMDQNMAPR